MLLLTPATQMFSSHRQNTVLIQRDNSNAVLIAQYDPWLARTMPKPRIIPYTSPSLPVVANKPFYTHTTGHTSPQEAIYPRVANIISRGGQCVTLAQQAGFNIHAGAARNWPTAARLAGYRVDLKPQTGSVIVTSESSYGTGSGHVALQTGPVENGYIPVKESNYISGRITTGWISINSPTIRSFIHKS